MSMMRRVLVTAAGAALGVTGCGWYTNIPAQVDVISIEPSSVAVEYLHSKPDSPLKGITAKFTNPTITLAGQPGSIGLTITKVSITYWDTGSGPSLGTIIGKEQRLLTTVRVGTSAMREDYSKGYQEMDPTTAGGVSEWQKKRLIIGQGKFLAPIVNYDVLLLGSSENTTQRRSIIYAQVFLEGEDDAHWPFSRGGISIPITFADTVY